MHARSLVIGTLGLCLALPSAADAGPVLFQATGANAAAIQSTVDAFRATLGEPLNGNAPGPLGGGRREINWDGGGATTTAATPPVFTGFQGTRGALLTTPGTGFVQAVLDDLAGNPTYALTFSAFSPQRIFAPLDSTITDTTFFVPGSLTPAGVAGFGAIFSDVDTADSTRLELFGKGDTLLFSQAVAPGPTADGSFSFLGVFFDAGELVTRARLVTGNTPLGPDDGPGVDVVVMDDFFYAEPTSVPEPGTFSLLAIGGMAATLTRRRAR